MYAYYVNRETPQYPMDKHDNNLSAIYKNIKNLFVISEYFDYFIGCQLLYKFDIGM